MTLPSSGTLTLQQIGTEFGLSPPFNFSSLYRGGGHVDNLTEAGTGSYQTAPATPDPGPIQIPTSGILEASHFYGTSSVSSTITIGGASCSSAQSNFPTGTTNCHVNILTDGTITYGGGGGATINTHSGPSTWNSVNGGATDWSTTYYLYVNDINVLINTGSFSPNAIGSTSWGAFDATAGSNKAVSVVFSVQIRRISDNVVMATFSIGLDLDNT